jgi:two-component system response regulator ChvI
MKLNETAASETEASLAKDVIRVLFVEDDGDFREALAGDLSDRGLAVQCFPDGASLLGTLDTVPEADVILLDWGLPGTSGIDLVPELRRRGIALPVVFLTGHTPITYESRAFERGAIDFIDKARGVDVLVARLRRAAKATRPAATPRQPDTRFICGKLLLAIGRAYWNGADVGLTLGEYKIVHLLASNVGRPVGNRAIYDQMHYEGFIAGTGENGYRLNVRSAIRRIRKKFRKCDPAFAEIENCAAVGYGWGKPEAPPGPGGNDERAAEPTAGIVSAATG